MDLKINNNIRDKELNRLLWMTIDSLIGRISEVNQDENLFENNPIIKFHVGFIITKLIQMSRKNKHYPKPLRKIMKKLYNDKPITNKTQQKYLRALTQDIKQYVLNDSNIKHFPIEKITEHLIYTPKKELKNDR